jgi:hypothetical protein
MRFIYTVTVQVERSEGKFASRDDMGEQIRDCLEQADPGQLDGENGGIYETVEWEVVDV